MTFVSDGQEHAKQFEQIQLMNREDAEVMIHCCMESIKHAQGELRKSNSPTKKQYWQMKIHGLNEERDFLEQSILNGPAKGTA